MLDSGLVMSLANEWTKLIGLYSLMFVASSFLGIKVIYAELSTSKLAIFLLHIAETAAIISFLIIAQHVL